MTRNTNHNSLVSTKPSQAKTRCQFQLPNHHWTRYFNSPLLVFQFWGTKVFVGYIWTSPDSYYVQSHRPLYNTD
ncbi:hypothetical protein NC651_028493 [Populus alba x Populus x berolinensis]|nr:hypothetical protein NC651_028493 [Populus alba x Populus x berolinensis]